MGMVINSGVLLSRKMHHDRAERWIVVRCTVRITRDDEVFPLSKSESIHIPLGTKCRLEKPWKSPLEMSEDQYGAYLGTNDIVRFDNPYERDQ